ncbi:hypothetical protein ACIQGO_30800 [Streptomyces shenzhenensis]|uniref:hypothetical protein n=1 Tax=Streptomyces shenzhenensis TaxID=943815 RepID=UPI003819DFD3
MCRRFGVGKPSWISAPEVFHLRPYGDESGPKNKVPFHLRAEDTRGSDRTGVAGRRLTTDLAGAAGGVRLWVKTGHGCHGTDTRVVCRVGGRYDGWAESDRVYPVVTEKGAALDAGGRRGADRRESRHAGRGTQHRRGAGARTGTGGRDPGLGGNSADVVVLP